MRLPRVLALCALVGFCWAVPAQAAGDHRGSASAQTVKNRPGQPAQSARRAGSHASATVRHRKHRAHKARITPGREVIDHSGRSQRGRASYYGREFNGRKMANGRPFNPSSNTAASRSLPLGTVARVKNRHSGRETTVKVEDRGPYVPGRILDVAPRAADNLGMRQQGVAPVVVEPVAVPQPDGSVKPGAAATSGGGQR
jgi:rare lipoprotein A